MFFTLTADTQLTQSRLLMENVAIYFLQKLDLSSRLETLSTFRLTQGECRPEIQGSKDGAKDEG